MRTSLIAALAVLFFVIGAVNAAKDIPQTVTQITFSEAPSGVSLTLNVIRDPSLSVLTVSATKNGDDDDSIVTIKTSGGSSSAVVDLKVSSGKKTNKPQRTNTPKATPKPTTDDNSDSDSGVSGLIPGFTLLFGSVGLWVFKGTSKTSIFLVIAVVMGALLLSSNTKADVLATDIVILTVRVPTDVTIEEISTYPAGFDLTDDKQVLNIIYSTTPSTSISGSSPASITPSSTISASGSISAISASASASVSPSISPSTSPIIGD